MAAPANVREINVFGKGRHGRGASGDVKAVGEHHGNSFGTYFLHRQLKTDEQVNT
jgi:hypothetical protein